MIANMGLLWEQKQREDAEAESKGLPKAKKLSTKQMMDMIKSVREQHNG